MALTKKIVPVLIAGVLWAQSASAELIPMTYCASINTADSIPLTSRYNSDGLCRDSCGGHAFAIVQASNCWCSDYVPAESVQSSTSDCGAPCPGFPEDTCGGDGLWGYIALDSRPSGTIGPPPPPPPTTTPAPAPAPEPATETVHNTETVQNTVTVIPPVETTTVANPTTVVPTEEPSPSPPPPPPTKEPLPPPSKPQPTVSVKTVTAGGSISYISLTVTPTSVPESTQTPDANTPSVHQSNSQTLSTGAAVGTAVGAFGAVVIFGGVGAWLWMRRRRRNQEVESVAGSPGSHPGSSAGVMGTPTTTMASVWDGENTSTGRRSSRLMPHDPRMDPFSNNLYGRFENKSRESVNTIQDNHDYSRKVLRTTNPDPEDHP